MREGLPAEVVIFLRCGTNCGRQISPGGERRSIFFVISKGLYCRCFLRGWYVFVLGWSFFFLRETVMRRETGWLDSVFHWRNGAVIRYNYSFAVCEQENINWWIDIRWINIIRITKFIFTRRVGQIPKYLKVNRPKASMKNDQNKYLPPPLYISLSFQLKPFPRAWILIFRKVDEVWKQFRSSLSLSFIRRISGIVSIRSRRSSYRPRTEIEESWTLAISGEGSENR